MLQMLLSFMMQYLPSYALGGINALGLTALGNTIDAITEQIPILRDAGIQGRYFTPFGSIEYWNNIFQVMKNTNRQLGIAGNYGAILEDNAMGAYENIIRYGGEIEDVATAFNNLIAAYGRNVTLSKGELESLGKLNVAFGQTFERIFSTNLLMGRSVKSTSEFMDTVYKRSDAYGINVNTALKALNQNIELIDRTSFRNGVSALRDMSINAERMRISVQETVSFAERMFDPDNAIETAAQLQLMGGEWAKMGDVFSLMFEGRNNPELLQKRIFEATRGIARLNEETGAIDIEALGVSQLRAISQITGQGMDHLMQAARQIAKEDYVSKIFTIDLDTQQQMDEAISKVASLAEYNKDSKSWMVRVGEEYKSVSLLNENDLEKLKNVNEDSKDVYKDLIESNRTVVQALQILSNVMMRNLIGRELYDLADEDIKKALFSVDDKILGSAGFKMSEAFIDNMQKQVYNIASKELGSLLTGDVKAFLEQVGENFKYPQQLNLTLEGVVKQLEDQGYGGTDMVKGVEDFQIKLNKWGGTLEGISEELKKLNKNIENFGRRITHPWTFITDPFEKLGKRLFPSKEEEEEKKKTGAIIPKEGSIKAESDNFFNILRQHNSLSYNGYIDAKVGGSVILSIEGGSAQKEMIFKNPDLQKEILGFVDPIIRKQMEQRVFELKEDSKRNNGLTNKPLILLS